MSSKKSFSSETSDRYAKAIFELALENNELDIIESNIKELSNFYDFDLEFANFIKNPTRTINDQINAINELSKIMKFPKTLKNFLLLLAVKRRIFFLKKIMNSFLNLVAIKRGELSAKLISSKSLSAEELNNISVELSKTVDSEINFDYKIDKSLIGGFKMQIGSLMIDTSLKNKLKKYEQLMLEK